MAKANAKKSQPQTDDEATGQETAPETTSDELQDGAEDAETAQAEGGQESQPEAPAAPATPALSLHTRLEKAVRTMSHSGNPEAAHALNKVELLVGTLKYSLPAIISVISDEQLKADLQALLASL